MKTKFAIAVLFAASTGLAMPAYGACKAPKYSKAELKTINPAWVDQRLVSSAITKASNYHRCQARLPKLRNDPKLRTAASTRVKKIRKQGYLSHLDKGSVKRDIRRQGVRSRVYAENLGEGSRLDLRGRLAYEVNAETCEYTFKNKQPVPKVSYARLAERVVDRWMNSKGHRYNLMYPKVKSVGSAAVFAQRSGHFCGLFYISQTLAD